MKPILQIWKKILAQTTIITIIIIIIIIIITITIIVIIIIIIVFIIITIIIIIIITIIIIIIIIIINITIIITIVNIIIIISRYKNFIKEALQSQVSEFPTTSALPSLSGKPLPPNFMMDLTGGWLCWQ